MFKGPYSALIISTSLHLLLLLLLAQATQSQPVATAKALTTPIKSYLYKRPPVKTVAAKPLASPKKVSEPLPAEKVTPEPKVAAKSEQKTETLPPADEATKPQQIKPIISETAASNTERKPANKPETKPLNQAAKKGVVTFSPYASIAKLRDRINEDILAGEIRENSRPRSISPMHRAPILVPHSTAQIDPDKLKKQNTLAYSDNVAITKGDDGTCTIKQDLSNVGMEGLVSVQVFRCGETKMAMGFRQHMKKVLKKLGK